MKSTNLAPFVFCLYTLFVFFRLFIKLIGEFSFCLLCFVIFFAGLFFIKKIESPLFIFDDSSVTILFE